MTPQVVDVKSAWLSKINIVAIVTAIVTLATAFGLDIPEETKVQILSIAGVLGPILIGVLRTYFTTTLTPASAAKL